MASGTGKQLGMLAAAVLGSILLPGMGTFILGLKPLGVTALMFTRMAGFMVGSTLFNLLAPMPKPNMPNPLEPYSEKGVRYGVLGTLTTGQSPIPLIYGRIRLLCNIAYRRLQGARQNKMFGLCVIGEADTVYSLEDFYADDSSFKKLGNYAGDGVKDDMKSWFEFQPGDEGGSKQDFTVSGTGLFNDGVDLGDYESDVNPEITKSYTTEWFRIFDSTGGNIKIRLAHSHGHFSWQRWRVWYQFWPEGGESPDDSEPTRTGYFTDPANYHWTLWEDKQACFARTVAYTKEVSPAGTEVTLVGHNWYGESIRSEPSEYYGIPAHPDYKTETGFGSPETLEDDIQYSREDHESGMYKEGLMCYQFYVHPPDAKHGTDGTLTFAGPGLFRLRIEALPYNNDPTWTHETTGEILNLVTAWHGGVEQEFYDEDEPFSYSTLYNLASSKLSPTDKDYPDILSNLYAGEYGLKWYGCKSLINTNKEDYEYTTDVERVSSHGSVRIAYIEIADGYTIEDVKHWGTACVAFNMVSAPGFNHLPAFSAIAVSNINRYRNPSIALYNTLVSTAQWGGKIPAESMNEDSFADFEAYCEEMGFNFDRAITTRMLLDDLIREILFCGKAFLVDMDGQLTVVVDRNCEEDYGGVEQAVAVIEYDDMLPDTFEYERPDIASTANRVIVKYNDKGDDDTLFVATDMIVENRQNQLDTGSVRPLEIQLWGIINQVHAHKIAHYLLSQSTYCKRTRFDLPLSKCLFAPGDVIKLNVAKAGLSNAQFRIFSVGERPLIENAGTTVRPLHIECVEFHPYRTPAYTEWQDATWMPFHQSHKSDLAMPNIQNLTLSEIPVNDDDKIYSHHLTWTMPNEITKVEVWRELPSRSYGRQLLGVCTEGSFITTPTTAYCFHTYYVVSINEKTGAKNELLSSPRISVFARSIDGESPYGKYGWGEQPWGSVVYDTEVGL